MDVLNKDQIDTFWRDGYLFLEDAVPPEKLASLANEFDGWVDQSRSHSEAFGTTLDGRPRFDVEPGHTAEAP
ncbi:MAG: phytanoyl-CoA dioxygenase family protein, partial [Victivallales bacterium]|nr:phytanoyl-CoA dioxygenase family protein [Victivallales bacterium]